MVDLGWYRMLVTRADGAVVWAWTHWVKDTALSERRCDAISFAEGPP